MVLHNLNDQRRKDSKFLFFSKTERLRLLGIWIFYSDNFLPLNNCSQIVLFRWKLKYERNILNLIEHQLTYWFMDTYKMKPFFLINICFFRPRNFYKLFEKKRDTYDIVRLDHCNFGLGHIGILLWRHTLNPKDRFLEDCLKLKIYTAHAFSSFFFLICFQSLKSNVNLNVRKKKNNYYHQKVYYISIYKIIDFVFNFFIHLSNQILSKQIFKNAFICKFFVTVLFYLFVCFSLVGYCLSQTFHCN